MSKSINQKLLDVQIKLKVPKNQKNAFGGYNFRSCEDILEAAKPILKEEKALITLTDEIKNIGDRYYVESCATFICAETNEVIEVYASAREADSKKGMDTSQVTGSTSSYARKYALNGLLALDDNKDSDTDGKMKEEATAAKDAYKNELAEVKENINALVTDLKNNFDVNVADDAVKSYIEKHTGVKDNMSIGALNLVDAKKLSSAYKGIIVNKQKSVQPEEVSIDDI